MSTAGPAQNVREDAPAEVSGVAEEAANLQGKVNGTGSQGKSAGETRVAAMDARRLLMA